MAIPSKEWPGGNAGANCAADHVVVLGAAIDQLPPDWHAGHQPGDAPALAAKKLLVGTDSAGASHWFAEECRDRNIGFALRYWIDRRVREALLLVQEEDWEPAREADGRIRDGAQVAEITDPVNLDACPDGTRLVVRRERPHPGAQVSLFDTIEGLRHTAFITDTPRDDLAALELRHRCRGRAEQIIRDTTACGLARLPFDSAANNDRWMQLTFAANDLLCWARRIKTSSSPSTASRPESGRHHSPCRSGQPSTPDSDPPRAILASHRTVLRGGRDGGRSGSAIRNPRRGMGATSPSPHRSFS